MTTNKFTFCFCQYFDALPVFARGLTIIVTGLTQNLILDTTNNLNNRLLQLKLQVWTHTDMFGLMTHLKIKVIHQFHGSFNLSEHEYSKAHNPKMLTYPPSPPKKSQPTAQLEM